VTEILGRLLPDTTTLSQFTGSFAQTTILGVRLQVARFTVDAKDVARRTAPAPFTVTIDVYSYDIEVVISFLHALSCSRMLVAAVDPDTKVAPHLFPLPFQVIPRDTKRCAPVPLRCASPPFLSGVSGPKPAAK